MIIHMLYIPYLALIKLVYFVYHWNEAALATYFNLLIQILY